MLIYCTVNLYTVGDKEVNFAQNKNASVFFSRVNRFNFYKKKQTHFSLNKASHVYKKSKEHFIFFWPKKGLYKTPTFTDNVSFEQFVSGFLKLTFVLNPQQAFYIKTFKYQ